LRSPLKFVLTNLEFSGARRIEMTNLRPIPTAGGIDWREARYLARVVQMLVKSPGNKAEFRRELENLLRAAEALRTGMASPRGMDWESDEFEPPHSARMPVGRTPAGMYAASAHAAARAAPVGRAGTQALVESEAEWAAERAVVELWRSAPAATQPRSVVERRARNAAARPVDEAELALAVEEIELAAAVLRAEELLPQPARLSPAVRETPMPVRQQVMEFWLPIAAAIIGITAALMSFLR
jgi:hypothetical protein